MSFRLYFGTDAPVVSPTFDASWEVTGSAVRRALETSQQAGAAFESLAVATASNSPAGAVDVLIAQYVSPPLSGDQTISAAIKGQVRALENNAAGDLRMQCVVWVRTSAGAVRGTLVASDASALASEFDATTLTNREVPLGSPVTPTTVNALSTDRIVVEVGYRKHENATNSRTGTLRLGNPTGTDLAEDESSTADNVPWIEFADTLVFTYPDARVTQVAVEVLEGPATSLVDARVTQVAVEVLEGPDTSLVDARVTQVAVEVLVKLISAVDFVGAPTSGVRPLTVAFTDLTGASAALTSWQWDFGDGTTSILQNPTHVYVSAGTYQVTLIGTGPYGADSETKVAYIIVSNPAPSSPGAAGDVELWCDWANNGFDTGGAGTGALARMMPEASPDNDDISIYMVSAAWQRGGQFDLTSQQSPGTLTIVLDNRDGRFTPDNAIGPYYGLLEPGRRIWLGMARSTGVFRGLFAGFLREIVPLTRVKQVQFIVDDPFGVWNKRRARVAYSETRKASEFRLAVLAALGITTDGGSALLDAEDFPLAVSGADDRNGMAVLELLNQSTGTRHWIQPADNKADFFYYRSLHRDRNLGIDPPVDTLTEDDIAAMSGYRRAFATVVNYQSIGTHRYVFGAPAEVWRSADVPFPLSPSAPTRKIAVSFSNWVRDPVLTCTVSSGAVTAVLTNYGRSALIELTATSPAVVGQLYITGKTPSESGQTGEFVEDLASQDRFGYTEGPPVDMQFIGEAAQARGLGEAIIARSRLPRTRPQVTIKNRFDKSLNNDLGDVISQSYAEFDIVSRRYEIVGASGSITEGGKVVDFGWTYLETPYQTTLGLFTLDDSTLDGTDILGS